jgi:hypothetical protein
VERPYLDTIFCRDVFNKGTIIIEHFRCGAQLYLLIIAGLPKILENSARTVMVAGCIWIESSAQF